MAYIKDAVRLGYPLGLDLIMSTCKSLGALGWEQLKECVALLIELYKKNVTVSRVASDVLSEWALSTAIPQPVVIHHRNRVVVTILEYHVRSD